VKAVTTYKWQEHNRTTPNMNTEDSGGMLVLTSGYDGIGVGG